MFEGGGCTELEEMLMEEKPTSRVSPNEKMRPCVQVLPNIFRPDRPKLLGGK